MPIDGYMDYQRREYCKDIRCPLQIELDLYPQGSDGYERTRRECRTHCRFSAHQFHHWLTNKGYQIVRPE
ncbi:MAG: hypothetical protein JW847_07645 [Candidatus Omnitrophica bacterium]|nr:hypothetical protein [Candidatus Omnitrophota bacterium]